MHKRLFSKHILNKLNHQMAIYPLRGHFVSKSKFSISSFFSFRAFHRNKSYPGLQFEFGLPLFFLKNTRIIAGKNTFIAQPKNILETYPSFIKNAIGINTFSQHIQAIRKSFVFQKYQQNIFKISDNEVNIIASGLRKDPSEIKQINLPPVINKSLLGDVKKNTHLKPIDSNALFWKKDVFKEIIRVQSEKFKTQNIDASQVRILSTHTLFPVYKFSMPTPVNRNTSNEIEYRVGEYLNRFSLKSPTFDNKEYKYTVISNRNTAVTFDTLTTLFRYSGNRPGFQKTPLLTSKDQFASKIMEKKQAEAMMQLASQNIIKRNDSLELIHRKPAEMINEPKNDIQMTTNAPQNALPIRMKPQGIVEPLFGNHESNIEQLADKVMDRLEQRLRTERERRGIFI